VGYYNAATCWKITIHRTGAICFRKTYFIIGDIGIYQICPIENASYSASYPLAPAQIAYGAPPTNLGRDNINSMVRSAGVKS